MLHLRRHKEPKLEQILAFCAEDPVERVLIEDMARRRLGRFSAVERDGSLRALCHVGANVIPSGDGCDAFVDVAARSGATMIIGEEGAVTELWDALSPRRPPPREDRPGQPVYRLDDPPEPGGSGVRAARRGDLDLLVPACAAAHEHEIGVDPLERDPHGFRWRVGQQIDDRRSWLWVEDGVILFKAEASAWTPSAVMLQQVWTDPDARGQGYASRGLRDLCRLLLQRTPTVCLFVRRDNAPAIRLYDRIGMDHVFDYRSLLF